MAEETEGNERRDDADVDPMGVDDGEAEASVEDPPPAGDTAGDDVWQQATAVPGAADTEATPAEAAGPEPAAAAPTGATVEEGDHAGADDAASQSGGSARTDDPARQFVSSVEGFLGSVFRDASEAVDRMATKGRERDRDRDRAGAREPSEPPAAADPAQFLDSVEGWIGDFFRGASGRAAMGFGRAAASSALRSATKPDDVWAKATVEEHNRDASRECRYCPFCQTLSAVRTTRPELYEQIGDTAKTLVDLVRQAAEQSGRRPWR